MSGTNWTVPEFVSALTRGVLGIKLGPGVLATIIPINTVGMIALSLLVYSLSANPIAALIGFALGLAFLAYANERAFRYAENNPIPALFSGGELLQLIRDQQGAQNKSIAGKSDPALGGSIDAIENKSGTDV